MLYRALSPSGDYQLGAQGLSGFYSGTDAAAQACLTTLRLLQSEWWEDTAAGLPLFQNILASRNKGAADSVVQAALLGAHGVQSITSYVSTFDGGSRTYTFDCVLQTVYGAVGLQEVTLGP